MNGFCSVDGHSNPNMLFGGYSTDFVSPEHANLIPFFSIFPHALSGRMTRPQKQNAYNAVLMRHPPQQGRYHHTSPYTANTCTIKIAYFEPQLQANQRYPYRIGTDSNMILAGHHKEYSRCMDSYHRCDCSRFFSPWGSHITPGGRSESPWTARFVAG